MTKINLNSPDIMSANDASRIWGHAENYVRLFYKQNPKKFPVGSIHKFGKQWVVTTEGMEAITGVKDPRKKVPEKWKPISGYEGIYKVSNKGRVRTIARLIPNPRNGKVNYPVQAKLKKQSVSPTGYIRVSLYKNGTSKTFYVHRLVMQAFQPNPNPKYFTDINHKNEVKSDNCVENLEWCSRKYNNNYDHHIEKQVKTQTNGNGSIKIAQYDLSGKLIKIWPSLHECARHGFVRSGIYDCQKGICKAYRGYKWKYLN